jgi:hypothetical protein
MERQYVSLAVVALLAGPVLAADPPAPGTAGGKAATLAAPAEDESWTWFGMGFENRRQHRAQQGAGFGPDSRPTGGFGGAVGGGWGGGSRAAGQGAGGRGNGSGRGR